GSVTRAYTRLEPSGIVANRGFVSLTRAFALLRNFNPQSHRYRGIRTMSTSFHPTPEQLALAQQRKLKREAREKIAAQEEEEKSRILPRQWVTVEPQPAATPNGQHLLAQCLVPQDNKSGGMISSYVGRELFPTSDCLKAPQREHMLYHEILSHNADIYCLQEVDRTEKLLPVLEDAGYSCLYAAGPRKRHGCLIVYRSNTYEVVRKSVVTYDDQEVRTRGNDKARRGSSFRTKNIASLVALRRQGTNNDGVVVATTHLFWHPAQAAILFREVSKFRDEHAGNSSSWPCIIAGVGDPLLKLQETRLEASRVHHATIDPEVPITSPTPVEDDEGAETGETDPDRIIVNSRRAQPMDGLLSTPELIEFFKHSGTAMSVYDKGQSMLPVFSEEGLTYGCRIHLPSERHGAFEPIWTSYTHVRYNFMFEKCAVLLMRCFCIQYWKAVLGAVISQLSVISFLLTPPAEDYIFVLDPPGRQVSVMRLAKPHHEDLLGDGLPMKGACGSDHISLAADLYWPPIKSHD
ncbi:putative RNA exonuclease C9B6.11c, partial [Grifola frondosa]